MNSKNSNYRTLTVLAVGEVAVAALTVLGFFIADLCFETGFSYNAIGGALLGAAVIVLNFLFLSISVNRAVDKYLTQRGNTEMSEEEAEKFTNEHSAAIQNSIKMSYIIRTVSMLATLVAAFLLSDIFNPLAAVIPMLAFRPIISLSEIFERKHDTPPDASKFIRYENEDDENEKESDN